MSDNDSFVTDHSEHNGSFNDSIFKQTDHLTDSQFNDQDMFTLIKSGFGQLDRKSFKPYLLQHTDVNDLRPIRNSLFDLIRKQDQTYNEAKLVERTQRENGHSLGEKLADDIFIIFQYIEGANNVSELKQCISRSRRTTVVTDENDAVMADIFNRLSNRTNNKPTYSAILLSMLMDIKQIITDTMKPISDNVEKLAKNFTNEISVLRNKLKEKDLKIENLQIEIQENQMRISRLQSEAKLHSQQLKELDNELQEKEQQKQYTDKISNRLDAIDNKRQKKIIIKSHIVAQCLKQ